MMVTKISAKGKFEISYRAIVMLLTLLLGAIRIASCQVENEKEKNQTGKKINDYTFPWVKHLHKEDDQINIQGGRALPLSNLTGKWIILDFWTRNCSPCIKSFPKIQSWQTEFPEKAKFILVGINDQYNFQIESFFEGVRAAQGINLPVAFDTVLVRRLGIQTVPTTVIVDPTGTIRKILSTTDVNLDLLRSTIK